MSDFLAVYPVTEAQQGQTLAAVLRERLPYLSWSAARGLVSARMVQINGSLCLDPARRVKLGDEVQHLRKPAREAPATRVSNLVVRHLDEHVVVVEKASGVCTVRHPAERDWSEDRRKLSPTLEDLTQEAVALQLGKGKSSLPRLRVVHRLDKETSGLVVFARSVLAERTLGQQFHAHSVTRRYLTIIPGFLPARTIESWLIRDRGDGRRGSGPAGHGKKAVTHVEPLERLPRHTLLSCKLETGRTHQIRIHLSEAGHPVCGEMVYNRDARGEPIPETHPAPRLALHATELGFEHPEGLRPMFWDQPLPDDLTQFLRRIR